MTHNYSKEIKESGMVYISSAGRSFRKPNYLMSLHVFVSLSLKWHSKDVWGG